MRRIRRQSGTARAGLTRGAIAGLLVLSSAHAPAAPGAAGYAVEAEQCVREGKVSASSGALQAQPMNAFGPDWSAGGQLFWAAPSAGAVLDIRFEVPGKSRWAVDLEMTLAPDYGQVQPEIDGKPVAEPIEAFSLGPGGAVKPEMLSRPVTWDGYAPSVRKAALPLHLGDRDLDGGEHRLSLRVIGKQAKSAGYYVGIDRLVLRRLPPEGGYTGD